jgi:hypothetical protein
MKKTVFFFVLILSFSTLLRSKALAEEKEKVEEGPCRKVMDACKAADFGKTDSKKSLFKDCMKPIMAGQKVTGVTVDPQALTACKALKEAKGKTK